MGGRGECLGDPVVGVEKMRADELAEFLWAVEVCRAGAASAKEMLQERRCAECLMKEH